MSDQLTPEKILQTGLAFWPAKTLLSAVEMGVFTELAHGPEYFDALSGRLGLHPRSARDFLDALVALGFLHRDASFAHRCGAGLGGTAAIRRDIAHAPDDDRNGGAGVHFR